MTRTVPRKVSQLHALLAELKRRSVFKVASVYAVTAWGASMGAAELLPAFGAPEWSVRVFVLFAVLGLPLAVALAWAYEITPEGIVRDEAGESADHSPALPRKGDNTTVLFGSQGTVRVCWEDASGPHERIFHRDFKIGRDESCELQLDDPLISRRHAEVRYSDGHWWISDLGSRNGTMLNQRLVSRAPLPASSEVLLYETAPVLRLEVRAAATARTITSSSLRSPGS
jgi:hypothetical protein